MQQPLSRLRNVSLSTTGTARLCCALAVVAVASQQAPAPVIAQTPYPGHTAEHAWGSQPPPGQSAGDYVHGVQQAVLNGAPRHTALPSVPAAHQWPSPAGQPNTTLQSPAALPLARPPEPSAVKDSLAAPSAVGTVVKTLGGLAVVVGLFLVLNRVMRTGQQATSPPLPEGVVEVLGRAGAVGQHPLQLVRFGNKLLLVVIQPSGASTLSEVTEPHEAQRLVALCRPAAARRNVLVSALPHEPESRHGRGSGSTIDSSV